MLRALLLSQGSSSHSPTCDASQGTCTTRGCQRRLSSDPLVGWHPAGEHFCCTDCINTAGARHSTTCEEVSQSGGASSATVPFRPAAVLPLTLMLSPLLFVPRVFAVVLSTFATLAHGIPSELPFTDHRLEHLARAVHAPQARAGPRCLGSTNSFSRRRPTAAPPSVCHHPCLRPYGSVPYCIHCQ